MKYTSLYHLDCDEQELEYAKADCVDIEGGKVRSVALIRKKALAAVLASPDHLNTWLAAISSGSIIILPYVSGSFEPGEPVRLKGYGRRLATRGPREMLLRFSDPSYKLNYSFYSSLQRATDLIPAYRTGSMLHIGRSTADLFASNPVEEDVESTVTWQVECRMKNELLPVGIPVENLASLFNVIVAPSTTLRFASGHAVAVTGLKMIARFFIGAPGAPMDENSLTYANAQLAGKRLLVMANGIGLPVDYKDNSVNFSGSIIRRVEKTLAGTETTFIGGVTNTEFIEIYTYEM